MQDLKRIIMFTAAVLVHVTKYIYGQHTFSRPRGEFLSPTCHLWTVTVYSVELHFFKAVDEYLKDAFIKPINVEIKDVEV